MNIKILESVKAWLLKNAKKVIINILIFLVYYQYPTGGSENEDWSPRALPPPVSYQFVHVQLSIIYSFISLGKVRLRQFLVRALRLGQARWPGAAAT